MVSGDPVRRPRARWIPLRMAAGFGHDSGIVIVFVFSTRRLQLSMT